MGKPSIYSKTRAQLRSDLALASVNLKPAKQIHVFPDSTDTREASTKCTNGCDEEEAE